MEKKHTYLVIGSISAIFFLLLILTPLGITAQEGGQQEAETVMNDVGTAFTYQGTLTDGGLPANGTYNLRFYLWSDETKTTLLGTYPSESTVPVEVIDGKFTAEIDFGAGIFIGQERWLELEVNGTLLSPLQRVTPAPYAIYAQTAPWSGLQGIPSDIAYGEFWSLAGNSDTTPGTDFLGTTDATPLEFRVNNARVLRLEPNTSSPNFIAGYGGNGADSGTVGATISGGGRDMAINQVGGSYSTVGGGAGNTAGGYASTVSGGEANSANHSFATLVGGAQNMVCGDYAFLGGGQSNTACASYASVFGGYSNLITGTLGSTSNYGSIAGGANNSVYGPYATVGGGHYNLLYGAYGTIAGGGPTDVGNPTTTNNRVYDDYGTISGGGNNTTGDELGDSTSNPAGTVSGGEGNTASGSYASVGGGNGNTASGWSSTVGGGFENTASGSSTSIGGGSSNNAVNNYATIAGGFDNTANGNYSTISGGRNNTTDGAFSTIPGGFNNTAGALYSFAAGLQAYAGHQGSFVWSDSTGGITSTAQNQFLIDADGGVGIGTDSPAYQLSVNGSAAVMNNGGLDLVGVYTQSLENPSAVFATGSYLYVTSAATNTLTIVDVTTPSEPTFLGDTTSNLHGPVDVTVMGQRAYVASEENDRLVILDVSNPSEITSLGFTDNIYLSEPITNPVALDIAGKYAYVVYHSPSDSGGLAILDVSDPANIRMRSNIHTGLDDPTDVFVSGDYAYVTSAGNDSLVVFDVSDPRSEQVQVTGIYADSSFMEYPSAVHVRGSYAYVLARNTHNLVVLDVSDPLNISRVSAIANTLKQPKSIFIAGETAYVTYAGEPGTAYLSGLAVFDIRDPGDIQVLSVLDLSSSKSASVYGSGNLIFVANQYSNSLSIFQRDLLITPVVEAGLLQAGSLEILDDALINNNLNVRGSLNVGPGGTMLEGSLAVAGPDSSYFLGPLSIGGSGDEIHQTPTHELDVTGEGRFRVNEYNHLVLGSGAQGSGDDVYIELTPSDQDTILTPTARIEFDSQDPFTHTTSIGFWTQGAGDPEMLPRVLISSDGNLQPSSDNQYSLGTSDWRWTSLWATNGTIQTSDGRLKEGIIPLPYGLDEINQLRPVAFNWVDGSDNDTHYGLIAQEVMEILPDVVTGGKDPKETLGLNYSELVPVLIRAVQVQQAELNTQADQIASLEARLAILEGDPQPGGTLSQFLSSGSWLWLGGLLVAGVGYLRRKRE